MLLRAFGKINLTLDIIGKRADGYHIIDSVFQSIGVFDTLSVEKSDSISVYCDGIDGENNLSYTAAKEFFDCAGISGGANIKIDKNIPVCAGLGGGSADAAAVIIALGRLYGVNLTKDQLIKIALRCGADVPFFLSGSTARVGGIGEKVEPIPNISGYYAVLIKAGEKKSTADMYRRLDAMPPAKPVTAEFIRLIKKGDFSAALLLADNAFCAVGADWDVLTALKAQNPVCASLSGSGPTHFAVFESESAAKCAAKDLESKGFAPLVAPFSHRAVEVVE